MSGNVICTSIIYAAKRHQMALQVNQMTLSANGLQPNDSFKEFGRRASRLIAKIIGTD